MTLSLMGNERNAGGGEEARFDLLLIRRLCAGRPSDRVLASNRELPNAFVDQQIDFPIPLQHTISR